jgi:hypothetical protein
MAAEASRTLIGIKAHTRDISEVAGGQVALPEISNESERLAGQRPTPTRS